MKSYPNKRKLLQLFFTIGSLAGTAAINYTIVHSPVVFIVLAMLLVHEIGHYLVAKSRGAKPDYPYFIPLFPFIIGVTRIKDLQDKDKSDVAIAGVIFSSLFMLVMIFQNLFFNIFSTFTLLMLLTAEILFNILGSDGKRYRKNKQNFAV